jgi:hypothetical protein
MPPSPMCLFHADLGPHNEVLAHNTGFLFDSNANCPKLKQEKKRKD